MGFCVCVCAGGIGFGLVCGGLLGSGSSCEFGCCAVIALCESCPSRDCGPPRMVSHSDGSFYG